MSCAHKINNHCTKYDTHCNIEPETMCAQYVDNSFCKHYQDNGVCSMHGLFCDIPYDKCKDYESNARWNNTHTSFDDIKGITTVKPRYCKFCFNARIYKPTDEERMDPYSTELTDENDFSSCSVGHCYDKHRRFMISSGNGMLVKLEFEMFDNSNRGWYPLGVYYPKFCPECGRKLSEHDVSKIH